METAIITNTGNHIVDSVAKMNLTGNVTPDAWYRTVVNSNGRPNTNAILILSEIVYWYRPAEVRDETTNKTIFKKKFQDNDFVQLSYAKLSAKFNLSEKQIREALKLLESIGVAKRHLRDVQTQMGLLHNVLFIELIPAGLEKITYPDNPSSLVTSSFPVENDILPQRETCLSPMEDTYTKTTPETTTEITTTARVDDKSLSEAVELFNGLNLDKNDITSILCAAQCDISRCQRAVALLNQQTNSVRNVVGWLIKAVREDYRPVYKASAIKKNAFNDMIRQDYDFDEIEAMILA